MVHPSKFRVSPRCDRGVSIGPLLSRIRTEIEEHGPITFARYMQLALYDSTYGFYAKSNHRGSRVDFVTSPEISPLFGYFIAAHALQACNDALNLSGSKPFLQIVEFGGARGTLVSQIASFFGFAPPKTESFPRVDVAARLVQELRVAMGVDVTTDFEVSAVYYCVVDPGLKTESTAEDMFALDWIPIPGISPLASSVHVEFYSTPDYALKKTMPHREVSSYKLVLANEVFDNLPSHLYVKDGIEVRELLVNIYHDRLVLYAPRNSLLDIPEYLMDEVAWRPLSDLPAGLAQAIHPDTACSLTEKAAIAVVSPNQERLAALMCEMATSGSAGGVLIFDLSKNPYESPVIAYSRHQQLLDPFTSPGEIDIMVPVQWKRVLEQIERRGLKSSPLRKQGEWLEKRGLGKVLKILAAACSFWDPSVASPLDELQARSLLVSAHALSDPTGLGSFTVLEASKNVDPLAASSR